MPIGITQCVFRVDVFFFLFPSFYNSHVSRATLITLRFVIVCRDSRVSQLGTNATIVSIIIYKRNAAVTRTVDLWHPPICEGDSLARLFTLREALIELYPRQRQEKRCFSPRVITLAPQSPPLASRTRKKKSEITLSIVAELILRAFAFGESVGARSFGAKDLIDLNLQDTKSIFEKSSRADTRNLLLSIIHHTRLNLTVDDKYLRGSERNVDTRRDKVFRRLTVKADKKNSDKNVRRKKSGLRVTKGSPTSSLTQNVTNCD